MILARIVLFYRIIIIIIIIIIIFMISTFVLCFVGFVLYSEEFFYFIDPFRSVILS